MPCARSADRLTAGIPRPAAIERPVVNQGPRVRLPSCPPQVQSGTRPAGSRPLLTHCPRPRLRPAPTPTTCDRTRCCPASAATPVLACRARTPSPRNSAALGPSRTYPWYARPSPGSPRSGWPPPRIDDSPLSHDPPGIPPRRLASTPSF